MSDDLIFRLRLPEEIVFPTGTEIAVCGGTIRTLEPFSMRISSSDRREAAAEIERLRAEMLDLAEWCETEEPLSYKKISYRLRAALEGKP